MNDFEEKRLETIRKNQEYLLSLDLLPDQPVVASRRVSFPKSNSVRPKAGKKSSFSSRKSSRLSGAENTILHTIDQNTLPVLEEQHKLQTFQEYFEKETISKAIVTDGKYKGWLHPHLVEKYNFKKETFEGNQKQRKGILNLI
jgi:hypothetical protein